MVKPRNTAKVIASWMILSWGAESGPPCEMWPMRLAGTWRAYSGRAMHQERRMATGSVHAALRRWPYQA